MIEPARDWFASRGLTPFPYQEEAWRTYLAGTSFLVDAPTGTGKTAAAMLGPILEALAERARPPSSSAVDELEVAPKSARRSGTKRASAAAPKAPPRERGLRVLWLTPMRALAGDVARAISEPIEALDLPWSVEVRTGDSTQALRKKQSKQLPAVLVTTPESLSLLLSRAGVAEIFSDLRAIVADEWHELQGSKRGVQLELALARLRVLAPRAVTIGLSATLGDRERALDVLVPPALGRPRAIVVGGPPRELSLETVIPARIERFPWSGHLGLTLLPDVVRAIDAAESTLVFTNVRSGAEIWFRALLAARPDWAGAIGLHHGSLDRALRASVEKLVREGKMRAVVCTSSLDLGVDFPAVDQVVQIGSPRGIARLQQRGGRSGHRPGERSRVVGVPTHAFELVEFAAVRDALERGELEAREPLEKPLDVLVQHLVTVALGGGFRACELFDEVRTTWAYRDLTEREWNWTLDFARDGGQILRTYEGYARLVERDGVFGVESKAIARRHRMSVGTITSDAAVEVRFLRGARLGQVEENFIARLAPGTRFVFAGRELELVSVREMTAYVRRPRGNSRQRSEVPRWLGGKLPLSAQLGRAVLRKLEELEHGLAPDPEMRAVAPLFALQRRLSRVPATGTLLVERVRLRGAEHAFVFPFEGRAVHEALAALVAWRLARASPRSITTTVDDYGFELVTHGPLPDTAAEWRALLAHERWLEDLLACLNTTELARRRFREIARIAGLVFQGQPGKPKTTRQIQASSGLLYDVFARYDPENLLLDQARREVLENELEARRLSGALERIGAVEIAVEHPVRLTPIAFRLWADSARNEVSSESWETRVRRMSAELEAASGREPAPGREPASGREPARSGREPARSGREPSRDAQETGRHAARRVAR